MINKILLIIRERGWSYFFSIGRLMIRSSVKSVFLYPLQRKKYVRFLNDIQTRDRVFLWIQDFGWNVPLFQRPQHIARCLADKNCTVFYYTNCLKDPEVDSIKEIHRNLFLVNKHNKVITKELGQYLAGITKPKYLHLYSTHYKISLEEVQWYQRNGYQVFYEYIDDLAPEISGTKEVPTNIKEIFEYVNQNDQIPIAVTADLLRDQIIAMRGTRNLAFSTNGVDIDFFRNAPKHTAFSKGFSSVLQKNQKIVGYYGAIASWFDYDLLRYAAEQLPDVSFVLIGKIYDDSYFLSDIRQIPNIHFIGAVQYADLPPYAARFNICMIPFRVNSITNATSPLKLFEYMALGKPILTTAMKEMTKYESVHIAYDAEDFVRMIKQLLTYDPQHDPEYAATLMREAEANTWSAKTDSILQMLKKYEQ